MVCDSPAGSTTVDEWQSVMTTNVAAPYFLIQGLLKPLRNNQGVVINITDIYAERPLENHATYCASKAGVLMFTKALAIEFSKQEVRVNAVCPGMVKTPLTAGFEMPEDADMHLMSKLSPLLEGAEPEEIAAAVAYIASPEARFITGAALPIDGAQTAG